jgi:hypothetical protein
MGHHVADAMIKLVHDARNPLAMKKAKRLAKTSEDEVVLAEEDGDPTDIRQGYVVVRKRDLEQ